MKHLLLTALFLGLATTASADVIHTRDGRKLEGVVDVQGDYYVIQHRLGVMRIPAADVESIEETPDARDELDRLRPQLAKGTADERYRFAIFARDNGFKEEAVRAFYDVLRVDTNHPGARAALGFVQHDGQWVTLADKFRSQGLVEYKGEWLSPTDRQARITAARDAREARTKAKADAKRMARDERREQREADREARRARVALAKEEARLSRLEYETARAEAEAQAVRNGVLNGYYVPGQSYPLYGNYRVLGNGFLYPQQGLYCPQRPVHYGYGRGGFGNGFGFGNSRRFGFGTSLRGAYQGGNWGLRWSVGF